MRKVANNWPASDIAERMKFAAQVFREALDVRSFESFRVALLDTEYLLRDIISATNSMSKGAMPHSHLKSLLHELDAMVQSDPLARNLISSEFDLYKSKYLSGEVCDQRVLDVNSSTILLLSRFRKNYAQTVTSSIIQEINRTGDLENLRRNVNYFCSHIMNLGFSRDYILEQVNSNFFNRHVKKVESRTAATFLRNFLIKPKTMLVWSQIDRSVFQFLEDMGISIFSVMQLSAAPANVQAAYLRIGKGPKTLLLRQRAENLDAFRAVESAISSLELICGMTLLSRRATMITHLSDHFVTSRLGKGGRFVPRESNRLIRTAKILAEDEIMQMKLRLGRVGVGFEREDSFRFFSAVNMTGLATETDKPESQFIAIWSALETLLGNPPSGVKRGEYYISIIVACMSRGYALRYAGAIYREIDLHYRSELTRFLQQPIFEHHKDKRKAFLQLNIMSEYAHLIPSFDSLFTTNPLLLYRLGKFRSNFSTPSSAHDAISQFEQRMEWQARRVYRTRNMIVHAGEVPTYIRPLTQNVYEMFKVIGDSILSHMRPGEKGGKIRQPLTEIKFMHDLSRAKLKKLVKQGLGFGVGDVDVIFSGNSWDG